MCYLSVKIIEMIDQLLLSLRLGFDKIKDPRYKNGQRSISDYAMCAFSMFHLKDPSLHHYRINYEERSSNLERIYDIKDLPSDSSMRSALDQVKPKEIQAVFKPLLNQLRLGGVMEDYKVLDKYQCVLFDGTQHYCTSKKPCNHCLSQVHRNKKGEITKVTYSHKALAAVIAHPSNKEVFPVACEAIVRQDGNTKNDCELNAGKRLLPLVREMLPKQENDLIGVFDGLYPNGPFIKELIALDMRYIIGIREGYVLVQVAELKAKNELETKKWDLPNGGKGILYWSNDLVLNGTHQNIKVNYFEYQELDSEGKQVYFNSWITDIPITEENIQELILVGRCRWKIENETFNTLKNQGYHLEHSYGHGKKFLATNFMLLTFLAFLTDQMAQRMDNAFKKAEKYCKTKKNLWEKVRQVFDLLPCMSMNVIYRFIAREIKVEFPLIE